MNVRVEYEATPIRHIAVQCPKCERWFYGEDIIKGNFYDLRFSYQIHFATFKCPICGAEFGGIEDKNKVHIEESSYPEVYDKCLTRKEIWE